MMRSGNLFLKVFTGFWLATIAIAGSWMLTNEYFEESPLDGGRAGSREHGPPHRYMLRKIYALQNSEGAELRQLLEESEKPGQVQIFLLDSGGQDYLNRDVPAIALATAQQLERRRRGLSYQDETRYSAHRIYRTDTGDMSAIFVFRPPPSTILRLLGASPALRLAMAVLISGLVCFVLSRLMTSRIQQLRVASRELANGKLDTRAPVRERGGDETDELARDFNSMAEQLQERILAQKRLLKDVSHELRSPLARLHVALALAEDDTDNRGDYLYRIGQEALRLEQLIAQLLTSQAENPVLDEHLDLVALLEVVAADARFEGANRGQSVEVSSTLQEAVIASSGDLLRKSFDNILRNAVLYSAPQSTIFVRLSQTDGHYAVQIEDEGPGVPEADLERIFQEFYRADTARTPQAGGYGLGLAIAQRAVALHGGTISAANSERGLCVTVTLPVPPAATIAH